MTTTIKPVTNDEIEQILAVKAIRENIGRFKSANRIKLLTMAMIQELADSGNNIAVEAAIEMLKERV